MSSIPSRKDLLIQILLVLENVEPGLTAAKIDSMVAENLDLDESVTKLLHTGTRTKYSYEMAWARSMGKKEGQLVLKNRLWSVGNETIRP